MTCPLHCTLHERGKPVVVDVRGRCGSWDQARHDKGGWPGCGRKITGHPCTMTQGEAQAIAKEARRK
jgi:hypothetical protein